MATEIESRSIAVVKSITSASASSVESFEAGRESYTAWFEKAWIPT